VHMLKAVQISEKVINNSQIRQDFSQLPTQLRQGKSLSSALGDIDYISGTTGKMFTVGEETGKIDEMVERVAEAYEKSLKQTIKNFLNAFEPMVMILLGGSVGLIVITMFLAISDLTNLA
jgi:general secretion pathway protein F